MHGLSLKEYRDMERGDVSDQPLSELEKEAELKRSTKPMFPPALDEK